MMWPPTIPKVGIASDYRSAITPSTTPAKPQGRWGSLDVSMASGVAPTFRDATAENDNDTITNTGQISSAQRRKTASLSQRAGQRPNAAVVLGVLSGLAAVGMAAPANRNNDPWIAVADAETLGKIGHDPDYPLNGNYRQTGDIDGSQLRQSIGDDTHPFTGQLRGEKGTISNLRNCLVKRVASEGRLDRLRFTDANIRSIGPTAVVACKISDQATVSNICVDNSRVVALGRYAYGGIVGGEVSGTVANTMAVNCDVKASGSEILSRAGIGVGNLLGGKVANTTAVNCTVAASVGKDLGGMAGIGAADVDNGVVANTTAVNCTVETFDGGFSGIGVGYLDGGTLANTTAMNCKVAARAGFVGIGAGRVEDYGRVTNTRAVNCQVENFAGTDRDSGAGIGAGMALVFDTVADTAAVNCHVIASGETGTAGIGVGEAFAGGAVVDTTAVNCTVATSGKGARAGIGAGLVSYGTATVANTTAVNCNVVSSGPGGSAGIGAGLISRSTVSETIVDTSALNCTVVTSGRGSTAGIGAGDVDSGGAVVSTTAINCKVDSLGEASKAAVRGGRSTDICNVRINGHWQNNTDHGCRSRLDNLCAGIDHRLLTVDCLPDSNFTALIRNNTRQFGLCPPTATITPSGSSRSGPAASGSNNAAIAGIALGGVLFLLIGVGLCIYRYCCHRASARVADNHAVGQSQGGSNPEGGSDDLELHQRSLADPAEGDNHKVPLISTTRL